MYSIYTTEVFDDWFTKLKDQQAKRRIQVRIDRVEDGNFGDTEPVGEGVSELRFFFGPGYRIYYCKQGQRVSQIIYSLSVLSMNLHQPNVLVDANCVVSVKMSVKN
jgi:putative addiction module killer protein